MINPSPPPSPGQFFLPELPRLIPVAYHPHTVQLETASNSWVRRFLTPCFANEEQLLRFLRERNGLYGALSAPDAEQERALCLSDWYQLGNVVETVSARSLLGLVVDELTLSDPKMPESPYVRAARDLYDRIVRAISPAQRQRLTAGLAGLRREVAAAQPQPAADDVDQWIDLRASLMRYQVLGLLTEYAAVVDMTPFVETAAFVDLHAHAYRQMIIVSDLISVRTARYGSEQRNAVRWLTSRGGLPLQEAVNRLCELAERHERAYIDARSRILATPLGNQQNVQAYLVGLDQVIAGSQEFAYLTPRHFGDGAVWDGTRSGWFSIDDPVTHLHGADEATT